MRSRCRLSAGGRQTTLSGKGHQHQSYEGRYQALTRGTLFQTIDPTEYNITEMTTEKVIAVLATLNHPRILLFMLPPKSFSEAAFGYYVTYKPTKGNKIACKFLTL